MNDKELKLDEIEASRTLGGATFGNSKKSQAFDVHATMHCARSSLIDFPGLLKECNTSINK
jgi:hypothetical protein